MKIYHKKMFASGIFCIALGLLNLIMGISKQDMDARRWVLMVVLLLIGIGEIARSLSKKMAREDKLEAMDERNRLITWKSKSKAFQLTQGISFFSMLILLVMGKVSGYEGFTAMGVGLAFTYTISMFAELGAYLYYESKN